MKLIRTSVATLAAGILTLAGAAGAQDTQDPTLQDPTMQDPTMQDPSMQDPTAQQPSVSSQEISSLTVEKVDKTTNEVTFRAKLQPGAQIQQDGQATTLETLQEGDEVRASFDEQGNITSLEVESSASSPSMEQESPSMGTGGSSSY